MIGQFIRQEAKREREEGGQGSENVRKPGLELGTPEVGRHCMSARCPRGYWRKQKKALNLLLKKVRKPF